MKKLHCPSIERIQFYKTYGNKYMWFNRNSITRENYLTAYICGERETFSATQDGVNEMEKWINDKRAEIAKKLYLEVEE